MCKVGVALGVLGKQQKKQRRVLQCSFLLEYQVRELVAREATSLSFPFFSVLMREYVYVLQI